MEKRKLGAQGLEVPAIGLGCMGMSFAYGKADEAESIRTLHRSLELGINFWDTAEIYGPFKNEELLAKVLAGRRKEIIIATKFAWRVMPDGTRATLDGGRKNMRRAIEGSLKRLGTDYVDLFYLHRLDPKTPIEDTASAMAELVKEGKVRYLGLSEVGPITIQKAHAVHPLTAIQSEYSFWERGLETKVLPALRDLGIGLVAYSPVSRGFLAGNLKGIDHLGEDDYRRRVPRFQPECLKQNLKQVDELKVFADLEKITVAQLALAWLLKQGSDIVPIPGTTKVTHLEENAKATEINFSPAEWKTVDEILQRNPIVGNRYPDEMMQMVQTP